MVAKSTLVRKISPATIAAQKLRRLDAILPGEKEAPKEINLYDVYGVVTGVKKSKENAERAWVGFTGNFEAVNSDGEIFQSGTVFTHQPITDMLYGALQLSEQTSEEGNGSVQFAIRVSIVAPKPGKPSITGYEFKIVNLIPTDSLSPLAAIKAQATAAIAELDAPRLAAPVAETPKEEAKAGKK